MPTDIYTKSILNYTTSLDPSQINNSINNTIEQRIKEEMEGKCINDGYIKKNSIKIVSRSAGKIMVSQFNGAVVYTVRYSADICNPLEGAVIKAEIVNSKIAIDVKNIKILKSVYGILTSPNVFRNLFLYFPIKLGRGILRINSVKNAIGNI